MDKGYATPEAMFEAWESFGAVIDRATILIPPIVKENFHVFSLCWNPIW